MQLVLALHYSSSFGVSVCPYRFTIIYRLTWMWWAKSKLQIRRYGLVLHQATLFTWSCKHLMWPSHSLVCWTFTFQWLIKCKRCDICTNANLLTLLSWAIWAILLRHIYNSLLNKGMSSDSSWKWNCRPYRVEILILVFSITAQSEVNFYIYLFTVIYYISVKRSCSL